MRKLLALAVIALIALTIAPAALAGNGPGGGTGPQAGGARYAVNGTVTAVGADSLAVAVKAGSRTVRKSVGKTVVLTITADTLLYERNADCTFTAITLADIAAGDRITSVGTIDRSDPATPVFNAHRVTLRPPLGTCPDRPN